MQAATVQLLGAAMGAIHGVVWVLATRWGRPGRTAQLRASLHPPPLLARAGYAALVVPLLYPVFAVIAPRWGYEGVLNWSSRIDAALLGVGLALWAAGVAVLVGAARTLRSYIDVEGVAEGHELVTSGPYRYVRHPIYGSFTIVVVGLCFVFRSYLLAAVAAVWSAAALWGASAEETLLASPEGLGDVYRDYRARTGRFLPRLRQ